MAQADSLPEPASGPASLSEPEIVQHRDATDGPGPGRHRASGQAAVTVACGLSRATSDSEDTAWQWRGMQTVARSLRDRCLAPEKFRVIHSAKRLEGLPELSRAGEPEPQRNCRHGASLVQVVIFNQVKLKSKKY